MRWAAHISLLLAIAVASASASPSVPANRHARHAADAPQASAQQHSHPSAGAVRTSGAHTRKSKTYAAGFHQGFVAGRSTALRHATTAHCAAPTPKARTTQARNTDARLTNSSRRTARTSTEPDSSPVASPDASPDTSVDASFDSSPGPARTVASHQNASLQAKRAAMPAPLRGSLNSLERQNDRLDAEGLERIEDERDLDSRITHKLLVPVPASVALTVNPELPAHRRYCRPWTAHFLADLARDHDATFHKPIEVSSAVRTVAYQKRLIQTNGNAAPAVGDIVSPHLTGSAIDIPKDGFTRTEIFWMRHRLLALQQSGKIDVEEEFQQSCFHITVYKSYMPAHPGPKPAAPRSTPRPATANAHALPTPPAATASRPHTTHSTPPRPAPQHPQEPAEVIVEGQ